MKQFTLIIFAFCSIASFAGDLSLENTQLIAEEFYKLGRDNNYLATKIVPTNSLEITPRVLLSSFTERYLSLQECAFIEQGAYDIHLEKKLQERMSAHIVNRLQKYYYMFYRIDITDDNSSLFDWRTGIVNAPCIVAIDDLRDGRTLLMSAALTD